MGKEKEIIITLNLSIDETNQVLKLVGKGIHDEVVGLIAKIHQQAQACINALEKSVVEGPKEGE